MGNLRGLQNEALARGLIMQLTYRQLAFFFRPTPYGFRQVVQHVSKHVAYEIN